jgi:hypothetical protein
MLQLVLIAIMLSGCAFTPIDDLLCRAGGKQFSYNGAEYLGTQPYLMLTITCDTR